MTWFYLSFVQASRPKGDQFVGGCYVEAPTMHDAITKSHILGINPGGEIQVHELPEEMADEFEANVPAEDRHRLLTREEIQAA